MGVGRRADRWRVMVARHLQTEGYWWAPRIRVRAHVAQYRRRAWETGHSDWFQCAALMRKAPRPGIPGNGRQLRTKNHPAWDRSMRLYDERNVE